MKDTEVIVKQLEETIKQNARIIEILECIWDQNDTFAQRYWEHLNYPRSVRVEK